MEGCEIRETEKNGQKIQRRQGRRGSDSVSDVENLPFATANDF